MTINSFYTYTFVEECIVDCHYGDTCVVNTVADSTFITLPTPQIQDLGILPDPLTWKLNA